MEPCYLGFNVNILNKRNILAADVGGKEAD
jgi:hypothetical protein